MDADSLLSDVFSAPNGDLKEELFKALPEDAQARLKANLEKEFATSTEDTSNGERGNGA